MKVIDCFTFYNELTVLEYRLATLIDIVDHFILVEARQTHMGKDKELYYLNNKERFSKYNHKIIHVVVDLPYRSDEINTAKDDGELPISIHKLEQDFYYYNLHSLFQHKWTMARILSFGTFEQLGLPVNGLRGYECPSIKRGGWHLSYFGDKHFIQNKLQNFAHAEHNTPTTVNLDNIQWHIDNTECIVGHEFKMKRIPLNDNEYPPPNADTYLSAFI